MRKEKKFGIRGVCIHVYVWYYVIENKELIISNCEDKYSTTLFKINYHSIFYCIKF